MVGGGGSIPEIITSFAVFLPVFITFSLVAYNISRMGKHLVYDGARFVYQTMHFRGIKQEKILPMQADNKSSRLSLDSWKKILGEIVHGSCARSYSNFSARFLWEFFDSSANLGNSYDFDGKSWGMRDIHRKL